MTGNDYADLIAHYIQANYSARGILVYREVSLGRSIIGKIRHIDILVVQPESARALAIECKFQDSAGTVDEKIPHALEDIRSLGMPACLSYAGVGFSPGIVHMLSANAFAAYCLPNESLTRSKDTRELDVKLAMAFQWWDIVVQEKMPFDPTRARRRSSPTST